MPVPVPLSRLGLSVLLMALGGSATAAAQRPAPKITPTITPPKPTPAAKPTVATKPTPPAKPATPPVPKIPESFTGIASKLGTTPAALETAFDAAHTANPKLTHGQFIAANVIAQNLGTTNSAITVQAILDGLKSGKSIGKTLQGLGLSAKDADAAEDAAQKEIKAAEKAAKEAAKPAPPEPRIPKSFDDLATKLGTTPAALETQFEAAHTADPKLTRREFLIADLVAKNLGTSNPAITLQALLDGVKGKGDRNLNKALESLGLTKKAADDATDAAEKEIREAGKPVPPKKP